SPRFVLAKGEELKLGDIALQANARLLDEIQVQGDRATVLHKIDRQVFEAQTFQSAQGGTAIDVLRNMPSVTVDALGEIRVRGANGFAVLLNGKPVQADVTAVLSQIPANAIENIEIITAPSAQYDAEGKAGIINILTKTQTEEGLFLQVNARVGLPNIENYDNAQNSPRYGGDFTLNYRQKKWDISLGLSYQRYDLSGQRVGDVFTIIDDTLTRFPSEGERSFDETNYSGRFTVNYQPHKRHAFSLGFFAGKREKARTADILYFDNHSQVLNEPNRLYTLVYFNENLQVRRGDFMLGSLDYRVQLAQKSALSASVLYEYTQLGGPTTNRNLAWPDTRELLQDERNDNQNPLHGGRLQLDYQSKAWTAGQLSLGYQFRYLDHRGDFLYERRNLFTNIFELIPEFSSEVNLQRSIHAIYGQFAGQKGNWTYNAGLRLEAMNRELTLRDKTNTLDSTYAYDFVKPFPSAQLQYLLNENLRFKAAYSRRVERTTTFKMNPFPEREHSETLEQGDPTLLPEFIDLLELGMVKDIGEQSFFATLYFQKVQNVVNRVNTVYNDSILNRIYANVGRAEAWGLELGSELKLTQKWKAYLGGNVYHYQIKGQFDNRPLNTDSWIYSFNLNTTWQVLPTLSVQASVNYISARNTAQGEDGRFISPNLTLRKVFWKDRLTATLQWLQIDGGILPSNEQRITTFRENEFFTTTNYIYEVDVIMFNLSYQLNASKNKAKFIKSEFGEREF
ncbi:MAG: TonB-dependent receptor, partial [Microscillaceae bacterium]|nr:TonB-dependent receptor [Microscillaceae bacterium]